VTRPLQTFVQCLGCIHYMGGEDFCCHPKRGEPGFMEVPVKECYERPKKRKESK
jgi:hypothetical protein